MKDILKDTNQDHIYQPYSYQLVQQGVYQRIRWFVDQRPGNPRPIERPGWADTATILPGYQAPYLARLGQYFNACESAALLDYLSTLPDFCHTSVTDKTGHRMVDYALLGWEHPFYSYPYFLDAHPHYPLSFRVGGVHDTYLQLPTTGWVDTIEQVQPLVQQWVIENQTAALLPGQTTLNWQQPYILHWNPLIHVSDRAISVFGIETIAQRVTTLDCQHMMHMTKSTIDAARSQKQPVDLRLLRIQQDRILADGDDPYWDEPYSFILHTDLVFRNGWTASGEQIVEGAIWIRLPREQSLLERFVSDDPLCLRARSERYTP